MKPKTRLIVTLVLTLASLAFAGANIYDEYLIPVRPMESAVAEHPWMPEEMDEELQRMVEELEREQEAAQSAMMAERKKHCIAYFVYWSLLPLMALAAVALFGARSVGRSFFGLSFFYAFAYAGYAFNGPSDPMGAGHMHLVLVPMLLLLVTFAPLFLNFLDLFNGKKPVRVVPVSKDTGQTP